MQEWKLRREGKKNMRIYHILVNLFLCCSMWVIVMLDEYQDEKGNTGWNLGWKDVKWISHIIVVLWMASYWALPPRFPHAQHHPLCQTHQSVGRPTWLVMSPRWRVLNRENMAAAWTPHTKVLRLRHPILPANMILQSFCEGRPLDWGSMASFSSSTPFQSTNSAPIWGCRYQSCSHRFGSWSDSQILCETQTTMHEQIPVCSQYPLIVSGVDELIKQSAC